MGTGRGSSELVTKNSCLENLCGGYSKRTTTKKAGDEDCTIVPHHSFFSPCDLIILLHHNPLPQTHTSDLAIWLVLPNAMYLGLLYALSKQKLEEISSSYVLLYSRNWLFLQPSPRIKNMCSRADQ